MSLSSVLGFSYMESSIVNGFKLMYHRTSLSKILQFRGYYIKIPHIAHLDEILGLQKEYLQSMRHIETIATWIWEAHKMAPIWWGNISSKLYVSTDLNSLYHQTFRLTFIGHWSPNVLQHGSLESLLSELWYRITKTSLSNVMYGCKWTKLRPCALGFCQLCRLWLV